MSATTDTSTVTGCLAQFPGALFHVGIDECGALPETGRQEPLRMEILWVLRSLSPCAFMALMCNSHSRHRSCFVCFAFGFFCCCCFLVAGGLVHHLPKIKQLGKSKSLQINPGSPDIALQPTPESASTSLPCVSPVETLATFCPP